MNDLRQRQPREECPGFLAFVRRKKCCVCGNPHSQAAHISMGDLARDKRPKGIAEKASDRWDVPLCVGCHLDGPDAQHKGNERKFWDRVGLDPFEIAEKLWAQYWRRRSRTPEQREKVVRRAIRIKRRTRSSRPIPSRPLKSANRWPPRGSRKFARGKKK